MNNVIFDMDGVIFDSESIWKSYFDEANKLFNINLDEEYYISNCGRNDAEIADYISVRYNVDGKMVRKWFKEKVISHIQNKGVKMKKGFLELIDYLKRKNVKIGLATGSPHEVINYYFSLYNINPNDIFDAIVTGQDVKFCKPNPEIYQIACRKLNSENCYIIEDSINGIIAGRDAGCLPIMVLDMMQPNEEAKEKSIIIFDNLLQVKDYFESIE